MLIKLTQNARLMGGLINGKHPDLELYPALNPPSGNELLEYILKVNAAGDAYETKQLYKLFESRTDGLIHQANTFFTYQTLNVDVPADDIYLFLWYFRWSYNSPTNNMRVRAVVDGDTANEYGLMNAEPPDAGGQGIVLPTSTGGTANTGTDQRYIQTGILPLNLTEGVHSIDLDYGGQNANNEATLYESTMGIIRL